MSNSEDSLSTTEIVFLSLDSVIRTTKKKCTFSALVKECFNKHPTLFALTDLPKWPDTLKLDRPLRTLREKGYITGSPITYYTISNFGYKILNDLRPKYYKDLTSIKVKSTRSPDLLLLEHITKSEDFLKFRRAKNYFVPNNMRIREVLKFTLETPNRTVISYIKHLRSSALKEKFSDIARYLYIYLDFLSTNKT